MPTVTAIKAKQMVLETSRQHTQARSNGHAQNTTSDPSFRAAKAEIERYKHCRDRHPSNDYWIKHPENVPSWFKDKMKEMLKEKGDKGRQVRKFEARVAGLVNNQGPVYSV